MTFGESISVCLKKYFVFEGRASRSEYWWFQLIVSPEDFSDIIKNLEDKKYDIEGDISLVPINTIAITSNDLEQVSNLIDKLEDHDDIQKVHTNLEVLD